MTRVIPLGVGHAGAGTTVVDNFFEESFLARLDELWKRPRMTKASTAIVR